MKKQILVAGVDVSKDTLDVYYNDLNDGEHALRVSNDNQGHRQLVECLAPNVAMCWKAQDLIT